MRRATVVRAVLAMALALTTVDCRTVDRDVLQKVGEDYKASNVEFLP